MPRILPNTILSLTFALALSAPISAQTIEAAQDAWHARDYATAAALSQPLAEQGNAEAMNILANLYQDGLGGLPQDNALALQWFQSAIDAGSVGALNNLGRVYHHGWLGEAVDIPRAVGLYERAIEGGSAFAMNNYAVLLEDGLNGPQNWPQIISLYEQAAAEEEPNAAANLANMFHNGRDGLPADAFRARQWAEQSLAVQSTRGARLLGFLLEFGEGGPQDVPRALDLYTWAWQEGSGAAANDLGLLYWNGAPGVPANLTTAAQWFERGIVGDDTWAHVNLANLLSDNDPSVPDDGVRARQLYGIGHQRGNLDATVSLSYLFWDGVGGPVDYAEARALLEFAAGQGDLGASSDLGVMFQQGLGMPIDLFQAASRYRVAAEGGHTLGAQNLAYVLLDETKEPVNVVEGLAWCYFSVEREEDRETQAEYRENCAGEAARQPVDVQRAALSRSIELLTEFR